MRTPPLETVAATMAFCRVVIRTSLCPMELIASWASSSICPRPDGATGMPKSSGAVPSTPNFSAISVKASAPISWLSSTKGTLQDLSRAVRRVTVLPPQVWPA